MRTPLFFALAVSASMLSMAACTPEKTALDLPPGKYERDVKSTDANGVTTERKSSTQVEVDDQGHKKAVVESKTTQKPPGFFNGMFNKTTTDQSKTVVEEK